MANESEMLYSDLHVSIDDLINHGLRQARFSLPEMDWIPAVFGS
jgi:hypothetical protein